MKRVYHPFWNWEDIGMWRDVTREEHKALVSVAVAFTGDHEAYGAAMLRVVAEMPIACEHNLTAMSMNRQAWIGHAAAYLATGCPEHVTREAWGLLTDEQRMAADAKAAFAIREWEIARKDRQVSGIVEVKGL
jgi:hypothetical protein